MRIINLLRIILLTTLIVFISLFSYGQKKKIGLVLHVYGPKFFTVKEIPISGYGDMFYDYNKRDSLKTNDKFYDAFTFFSENAISPYDSLLNIYTKILDSLNYDLVSIQENINDKSIFPIFKKAKNNAAYFMQDLSALKEQYNIDSLLTLTITYGFELETFIAINLDKRTKYQGKLMLIDLNKNKIESNGRVSDIVNIKNWNQPPDYPTMMNSYEKLLSDELYPTIQKKLLNIMNGKRLP